MEKYKKLNDRREVIVLKKGGRFTEEKGNLELLADEISSLEKEYRFLLIHGGGNEVSRFSELLGQKPVFRSGIRITTTEEMDTVEMILAGRVNRRIVRIFRTYGIDAVGLSGADGSIFIGESIGTVSGTVTRTGNVVKVNPRLLEIMLDGGYIPVISPVSTDLKGEGLNINADSVAFHLSRVLIPETLVFVSDIPGILKGDQIVAHLNEKEIQREIKAGVITGGMIPKVEASGATVRAGVGKIVIGEYKKSGDLKLLIEGNAGTVIDR